MAHSRQSVLIIAESATLAHVARSLLLATSLPKDRFEVHFAADSFFSFVFKDAPVVLHPIYSRSPIEFQSVLAKKGVIYEAALLRRYVEEELSLIEKIQPRVVVGDMRPSLAASAPFKRVPYALVTNAYWCPEIRKSGLPPMYSESAHRLRWSQTLARLCLRRERAALSKAVSTVFAAQAKGIDTVRAEYGLPPFSDYLSGFTWSNATLYCDPPELFKTNMPNVPMDLPGTFLGPVSWSPKVPLPSWWGELHSTKPIAYISLGSSGPTQLLPEIIDAVARLDLQLVVSTAGAPIPHQVARKAWVAEYLPGELLLPRCAVAITNGGSPSTYQAFQAGVPVLGIPSNMDQLLCMEHSLASGACLSLRADMCTGSAVLSTIARILGDSSFQRRATDLGARLSQYNTGEIFTDAITSLCETGAEIRHAI